MVSWFGSGYSPSSQVHIPLSSEVYINLTNSPLIALWKPWSCSPPMRCLRVKTALCTSIRTQTSSSCSVTPCATLEAGVQEYLHVTGVLEREDAAPAAPVPVHSVSLYHSEMKAYAALSVDSTHSNHYRFTALESCSSYAACVEVAGSHSLTCLSTITDPEVPRHFQVTTWNSSSVTVSWDCPDNRKFSFFLVTVLYLNGTNHVLEERSFRHTLDTFVFSQSDLPPCSRVKFGLQTVCQAGTEARHSRMVLIKGNTGPRGVSELRYRPEDSTALWIGGTRQGVAFQYQLSYDNGSTIQQGRLMEPLLPLLGLIEGARYALDVWEECDGEWSADPALVCFDGVNVSVNSLVLPVASTLRPNEDQVLAFIVPWLMVLDPKTEPWAELKRIYEKLLEELLKEYPVKTRVELVAFKELEGKSKTKITFQGFDASITDVDLPLPPGEQLDHIQSLQPPNITVKDGIIYWDDPDECATPELNRCDANSLCVNTLNSYTCVCQHGFYDVGPAFVPPPTPASHPVCYEKGMFTQCLTRSMAGGIAKAFLIGYFGGDVTVVLNEGRCTMEESKTLYHFHVLRKPSQCGTIRLVNRTHIEFRNTLTVTLSRERTITRRDLKVIWKCIYPRNYVRNNQINVDLEWITSHSVVEYNSSHQLGLAMTMYSDNSFSYGYRDSIALHLSDVLFFEVALLTNNTFASEVLLEVISCWATESPDPQDETKGFFLLDGCPVDSTFHWLSVNGVSQRSRFSIHMFTMPKELPIYMHCLARICSHDEDCTTNCTTKRLSKRSTARWDPYINVAVVVSAGPLMVTPEAAPGTKLSNWDEALTMIYVVGGTMGVLMLTMLGVSATKAIMNYYEGVRPQ
uniref:Uromodulin-like 1 n=1 Tax=Oncorhynchus tshawytscha TaxID=74940 RepID=A0AAZ3P6Q1_ONCTS